MVVRLVEEADAAGNDLQVMLLSQTHHAFYNPKAGTDPTAHLFTRPLRPPVPG